MLEFGMGEMSEKKTSQGYQAVMSPDTNAEAFKRALLHNWTCFSFKSEFFFCHDFPVT